MIVTFILNIFYYFIYGLTGLLPVGHLPDEILTAVNYFVGIINAFSYVIPVQTIFQAFALIVAVDLAILLWHFINWIIRKIPGMH